MINELNYDDDYYDDEFDKLRCEAHRFMKNKEESVIKQWLSGIGYDRPVGYFRDSLNKRIEIYTTNPGILIGRAGVEVEKLKQLMTKEFHGNWEVNFIEIRGGFVQI